MIKLMGDKKMKVKLIFFFKFTLVAKAQQLQLVAATYRKFQIIFRSGGSVPVDVSRYRAVVFPPKRISFVSQLK